MAIFDHEGCKGMFQKIESTGHYIILKIIFLYGEICRAI